VLLQTGAAYVSIERIHNLYRMILLGIDNVESSASRGNSWRKMPVALCITEVKCLVNRSLESRRRPRYRTCGFHRIRIRWKWKGARGTGRRRVNKMASVLWILTGSFHLVK